MGISLWANRWTPRKNIFLKKVLQNVRSKLKNIRTYFLSMKKYSKPPVINHKMSNLW